MKQPKLKVVVLVHDLASNCLGRGFLLAQLIKESCTVRIAGPLVSGKSIWPPCPKNEIPLDVFCDRNPTLAELGRMAGRLEADVLLASKLKRNSYGLALMARHRRRVRVLLDIDDWEAGEQKPPTAARWLSILGRPWKWRKLWDLSLDRLAHRADGLIVASTWLQDRYGGRLLPHVRDTAVLNPARFDGQAVRRRLGLEKNKVVLFLGTPRRHKGLEDVVAALRALNREDVRFLIVGGEAHKAYLTNLQQAPFVVLHPPCPLEQAPEFLAAADVVVVPQRDTGYAQAQLPAKLIDAMAMGRPIVATAVSDIPALLQDCGLVARPGDVPGLASALDWVFKNPSEAALLGQRAREKAVRELSYETGRKILVRELELVVR